jgi:hypothetical protein
LRDILSLELRQEVIGMHKFRRDVDHKLRVLQHADKIGDVGKACRYFGVGRQLLSLWTALPLQVDFELIRLARCKHLSGVTRSIGAPKWGIRSHLPLQLVGL